MPARDPRTDSTELAQKLAGEIVHRFGEIRLRAFGTSMAPSVLPGDLISIHRAGLHEISPGEIVLFSQNERWFLHRVVRRAVRRTEEGLEEPFLITRGDRLSHDDPPVFSRHLLGRAVSIERGGEKFPVMTQPGGCNTRIARLLRASDRATYLYLRVVCRVRNFLPGEAGCRA